MQPHILAQSEGVVAVYKPPGLNTEPAGRDPSSLTGWAESELGTRVHACNRLDKPVSGVVLLAHTTDGRRAIARAQQSGAYRRRYVAVVAPAPEPAIGEWTAPLGAARKGLVTVGGPNARKARTGYRVHRTTSGSAILLLTPSTGRTHQLRVHCANAGTPIVGDKKYGGLRRVVSPNGAVSEVPVIALHAWRVQAPTLSVEAPIPPHLVDAWLAMGGAADALQQSELMASTGERS